MNARTLTYAALALLLALGSARADDEVVKIRLVDATASTGLEGVGGDRFAFGDVDNDGDPDLLVGGTSLYRNDTADNDGAITFTDVTQASGIRPGGGGGGCFVDVDADGDLDVVTPSGAVKIQTKPWTFENRGKAMGIELEHKMSTVGVGDVDGDGWPDILFGGGENWNDGNAVMFPRKLFRNMAGKRFEDVSETHDIAEGRYGRAVVFADFDTDGDQDAYMGNYRLQPNELLVNRDGVLKNEGSARGVEGRFEEDTHYVEETKRAWGLHYGHTIAASWVDLDADGDLDLWVSNLVHKYVGPTNHPQMTYDIRGYVCDDSAIYRNDGAPHWRFTDMRSESDIPLMPLGGRGTFKGDELWSNSACGDLDGDGLPEVFVAQVYDLPYSHTLLFKNQGDFRFEEIGKALGVKRFASYGGAFADLDGDGDLDLVCGGKPEPKAKRSVRVYRNDTESGPWIGFRLEGRAPNTQALGAQVVVETDRGRLVRQVESCMGSHCQQNESVLRFGLRGRTHTGVVVRWPGNVLQRLGVQKTRTVHVLREPETDFPEPAKAVRLEGNTVHLIARGAWSIVGAAEARAVEERKVELADGWQEVRLRLARDPASWIAKEYVVRLPRPDDSDD